MKAETCTADAAKSPACTFANAITCGDIDCLQHECDMGIAEELHMLAILTQQACSAAVMVWPGITQAASGCPKSTRATATAAICVALFITAKNFWLVYFTFQ